MKGKLPDFLIIGAQKAGTTSLWTHLKKHPEIEMSPNFESKYINGDINQKEVNFFSEKNNWIKGITWYKSLFNNNSKLQGECTPEYICLTQIHKKMYQTIPDVKLIIILRNPIDRAYSSYNHGKQIKYIRANLYNLSDSFEEAIKKSLKLNIGNNISIINRGFYINQIENLLKYYKKDQLLILISEKMKENPQETYNQVFDFLGVKGVDIEYMPNIHSRKYKEPMKPETRELLKEIYQPYNEKLFEFLGYRIEEWKS